MPKQRPAGFNIPGAKTFHTVHISLQLFSHVVVLYPRLWRANKNTIYHMRYYVYVIELSKKVFTENARFRAANPQFNGVLQCLYVGMTSKTPYERFRQHKTGYVNKKGHKLSASIVEKYGTYLRPSLYNDINEKPMTRAQALLMEEQLALQLRRQGYAVWFN